MQMQAGTAILTGLGRGVEVEELWKLVLIVCGFIECHL
jgi:hypothetical protein